MRHAISLTAILVLLIGCRAESPAPGQREASIPKNYRVIEFRAPWCGPCKTMKPIIDQYESMTGRKVERVNVDENPELAGRFEVFAIPTVVVVRDDDVVDKKVGVLGLEELKTWLALYD